MKFNIIRSRFLEGLKSVQNIVAGKGSLPILQNVLLEANGKELTSSDILFDLIQNGHVGDKITLTLVRINSNYETTEFEVEAVLVDGRVGIGKFGHVAPRCRHVN